MKIYKNATGLHLHFDCKPACSNKDIEWFINLVVGKVGRDEISTNLYEQLQEMRKQGISFGKENNNMIDNVGMFNWQCASASAMRARARGW